MTVKLTRHLPNILLDSSNDVHVNEVKNMQDDLLFFFFFLHLLLHLS